MLCHEGRKDEIMPTDDVKTTAKKTITELVVKSLWTCVILVLGAGSAYIISLKKKLVQHPSYEEISFWMLLTAVIVIVVILMWSVRIYRRYGRFREAFGVFWDKNYKMRCLSCRKPLKHSSTDAHLVYCSDPDCNSKHILKSPTGEVVSPQEAVNDLKQRPRR